jgi:hypothetical protein
MNIQTIWEFSSLEVLDRGIPNRERVVMRTLVGLELPSFILATAIYGVNGLVLPFQNRVFFFDDRSVEAGNWIVVYTGAGITTESRLPTTHEKAYVFHWGHTGVIFSNPSTMPVLFRLSALMTPITSPALNQPPLSQQPQPYLPN